MSKLWQIVSLCIVMFILAGGCIPEGSNLYTKLQSEDPSVRLEAIHTAGQGKDPKTLPYLVDRLSDSEQEIRFFAILALERITGQTMGYEYYGPVAQRNEAVRRWRDWLALQSKDAPDTQEAEVGP